MRNSLFAVLLLAFAPAASPAAAATFLLTASSVPAAAFAGVAPASAELVGNGAAGHHARPEVGGPPADAGNEALGLSAWASLIAMFTLVGAGLRVRAAGSNQQAV